MKYLKIETGLLMALLFLIQSTFFGQSLEKQIDEILLKNFKPDLPGCAAIVVKDGSTLYHKAFGMANMELNVSLKPEHIFRIGSITKQFTACAILKLMEEGKLSLDDEITKFVKDFPVHGNKITIKHLLTHTSGIKSYTGMKEWDKEVRKKDFTPGELIEFFKNQPMDFKPDEEYRYNNSGYFLLGYIIEQVSGKTYAQYIEENFFKPLGMNSSYYDSHNKLINNRAAGYQKNGGTYENADYLSTTQPYAAGSLLSTVEDLAKWYQAVVNYKVIKKESLEKALSPYLLKNGKNTRYGFGWAIENIQGSDAFGHGGGINGYLTASVYLKNENIFVAVFSNCDAHPPGDAAYRIAALVLGKPYVWTKIELPEKELKEYEGVYTSKYDGDRIITAEKGKLFSMRTGGSKFEFLPFEKDKFFVENGLTTLEFTRDRKKKILSVVSKSTNGAIEWTKTDKKIPVKEGIKLDLKKLQSYVGNYELQEGFALHITIESGKVMLQATGQEKSEIFAEAENKFFSKVVDATIEFVPGEDGKAKTLILNQGGQRFECNRIE